jgi:signal transduction histidine kinase
MDSSSVNVYILVGTIIISLMGFGMILFVFIYQKQRLQRELDQQTAVQKLNTELQLKLLENSLEVQEFERRRIAKDLHDEVGALLSASKMSLNLFLKAESTNLNSVERIENIRNLLDESIGVVRNISRDLVPRTLENFGLIGALEEFIHKMHTATGIKVELEHLNIEEGQRFDQKIELAVFRIIQELTNNSIKHSEADNIIIQLVNVENHLKIIYKDNGIGFNLNDKINDKNSGLGLKNLQSRVEVLGGKIEFNFEPEFKSKVLIHIKLQ